MKQTTETDGIEAEREMASNGTPIDELTEQDWDTPYEGAKFDTIAAEKIYTWSLDQQPESIGNSIDWHWWAAKFDGNGENPALGAGVIVEEMSRGLATAVRHETKEEYDKDWSSREQQYEEYCHAECKDGMECEGCFMCENT